MSKRKTAAIGHITMPNALHYICEMVTPTQRITSLEADVARLQWQVAKLLEKPRKRKPKKK